MELQANGLDGLKQRTQKDAFRQLLSITQGIVTPFIPTTCLVLIRMSSTPARLNINSL